MHKIKKNDEVIVLTGKDSQKRGLVLGLISNDRVIVEGINRVKTHQRPNPMKGITGGVTEKEASIHISNVALFNPATQKADRVGIRSLDDGRKVRFFKSNGEVLDK